MPVQYHLRDINPEMVDAWRTQLGREDAFTISSGDIFAVSADAIVSPANSFGFMDGGIDRIYSEFFGWSLPARLQEHLWEHCGGELPIGNAVIVPTGHETIRWLICAPTMRVPGDVSQTVNAYLAFRAVLRAVDAFNAAGDRIRSVLCPGLGTAVGRMPAARCAYQMHAAWGQHVEPHRYRSLGEAGEGHYGMLEVGRVRSSPGERLAGWPPFDVGGGGGLFGGLEE
ncbi:MAG: O-acetyl-ADP-ribose deacetylase (regulator of RNase III) [Myxococcota bacterium]|jgi:O-acetyl-ADP-ribose deacetylase (regulator of RNase III)